MSKISIESLETYTVVLFGIAFVLMMANATIKREVEEVEDTIIGILS
tara:strand:+ start:1634 stop:1774 length:141 start_codon:yes stop_codon:yes gene_type:complete